MINILVNSIMSNLFGEYGFKFLNQELILLPQKAIVWKNKKTLILSDLHLGKAGHFRKAGIPIPKDVHNNDLCHLTKMVQDFNLKKIIFLGDLFHSNYNDEWQEFINWTADFPNVEMILVKGNHDIMPEEIYTSSVLKVIPKELLIEPFLFTHEPVKDKSGNKKYTISGHIHPAFTLYGKGRQSLTLPCFYFGENQAILPAFGSFTGNYRIQASEGDKIFLVSDRKIILV